MKTYVAYLEQEDKNPEQTEVILYEDSGARNMVGYCRLEVPSIGVVYIKDFPKAVWGRENSQIIDELRQENDDLEQENRDLQIRIDGFKTIIKDLTDACQTYHTSNEELEALVEALQEIVLSKDRQLSTIASDYDNLASVANTNLRAIRTRFGFYTSREFITDTFYLIREHCSNMASTLRIEND